MPKHKTILNAIGPIHGVCEEEMVHFLESGLIRLDLTAHNGLEGTEQTLKAGAVKASALEVCGRDDGCLADIMVKNSHLAYRT